MPSKKMLAAQAMVECLIQENVSTIFGYPGAAICPFYDALRDSEIRHILVRQEQNAGHAASGYARISGKPGVCVVTSGPGATNLVTAIATSYADSIPLIAITGQVDTRLLGHDVFQEVDITGSVEPFVKHSYLVKRAQDIPQIFKQAFHIAATGRPGPVLIDIPFDIQMTEISFEYPECAEIRGYKPSVKGHAGQIKKVAQAIAQAQRPLICAGGGIITSHAQTKLRQLSEICGIPVITTMMGLGSLPSQHPFYYGMLGTHGVRVANYAIGHSDLLILIGARVSDRAIHTPSALEQNNTIVHIDVDPAEIGKNVTAQIPVVGDANTILKQLLEIVDPQSRPSWKHDLDRIKKSSQRPFEQTTDSINPREFMTLLSKTAPEDCIVVADVGQNQIWAANYFQIQQGHFLTTGGFGTMGYALGAAIGAKAASPKTEVIAVCGDGAFQMEMMELATSCQHRIPVKVIVMKNNRLGMVREYQMRNHANRLTSVFLDGSPNFATLASAYGIPSHTVDQPQNLKQAIAELYAASSSYLLEVIVNEDEPSL